MLVSTILLARNDMRCFTIAILTAVACLGIAISSAVALTAKDEVGSWTLESDVSTTSDGHKLLPFGPNPKGIAIFDNSGRFAIVVSRPDLPKFASDNRMQGTTTENEAIVHGSIAFFGTYLVKDGAIIQHVEGGTWPGWIGTDQKRTVASFTKDEQTWTTVPSFGGTSELRWRRSEAYLTNATSAYGTKP
jgi:hypothetical protein